MAVIVLLNAARIPSLSTPHKEACAEEDAYQSFLVRLAARKTDRSLTLFAFESSKRTSRAGA